MEGDSRFYVMRLLICTTKSSKFGTTIPLRAHVRSVERNRFLQGIFQGFSACNFSFDVITKDLKKDFRR